MTEAMFKLLQQTLKNFLQLNVYNTSMSIFSLFIVRRQSDTFSKSQILDQFECNPTENKAAYSRIILLIKKCVFMCIMAIYDKKDSVNTCKTSFTHVITGKMKKRRRLHLNYGIRVSYFRSRKRTIFHFIILLHHI